MYSDESTAHMAKYASIAKKGVLDKKNAPTVIHTPTGLRVPLVDIQGQLVSEEILARISQLAKRVSPKLLSKNQRIQLIIFDPVLFPEEDTPELPGYGSYYDGVLRLTKKCLTVAHRIPNIPALEATLLHEAMESLLSDPGNQSFINLWASSFGFHGQQAYDFPVCTRPSWCVSDYAKLNARQDICDSVAALYLKPELLYRGKQIMLKRTL